MSNACNKLGLITLYRIFSCLHNTILMKSPSRSSPLPIVLRTRRGVKRRRLASQRPLKIHGGGLSNTANSMQWLRELNIETLNFITPFQQDVECHHPVLNWLAMLSERIVRCLKMAFKTRLLQRLWTHARTAQSNWMRRVSSNAP